MKIFPRVTLFLDDLICKDEVTILELLKMGIKVDELCMRSLDSDDIVFAKAKTFKTVSFGRRDIPRMKDESFVDKLSTIYNLKINFHDGLVSNWKYDFWREIGINGKKEFVYFFFKMVSLNEKNYKNVPTGFILDDSVSLSYLTAYPRGFAGLMWEQKRNRKLVLDVLSVTTYLEDRRFIWFHLPISLDEDEEIVERVEFGKRVAKFNRIKEFDKLFDFHFKFK
jgi:hypothetical protein